MAGFDRQSQKRIAAVVRKVEGLPSRPPRPRRNPALQGSGNPMFIAEVDSDATGGGYYNCHLQTLDATDWNTNTADQFDDTGDSVVVLNMAEVGTSIHNLDAGDKILCWGFTDDEGNTRLVGFEVFGRHTFGEW